MNQGCREQQKETWFSPNSGLLLWLGELFTTGAGGSHPVVPPIGTLVSRKGHQPRDGSYSVLSNTGLGRTVTLTGWSPLPVLASVP